MKRCKVCRKKPCIKRRVNADGVLFCSDECYDIYGENVGHPQDDWDHPYIDDYETIRMEYIRWMEECEDRLYKFWLFDAPSKEDLLEELDEFLWEFNDFIGLAGSDGVFSYEVNLYIQKFSELMDVIRKWEPDTKELKRRRGEKEKTFIEE